MTRWILMAAVLVAATLAGCTAGNEAQPGNDPAPTFRQAPQGESDGFGRGDRDKGNATWRGDLMLEVDPKRGPAPLNVTITYDVGGKDEGQGRGGDGDENGTAGNGTSSGNATADSSGSSANANLTWTLRMWRMAPDEVQEFEDEEAANGTADGNATAGNGTPPSGNATGNTTGNATGNTTGNATGNSTGNATGNSTGTTTSWTGTSTGSMPEGNGTDDGATPSGPGNLTLQANGTMADLPGATTQLINATGQYKVRFIVDYGNGTERQRTAVVHVRGFEEGEALGNETKTFEGSFLAADPLLCQGGSEEFDLPLNATFGSHGALVSLLNVTLEPDGFLDSYEMVLTAPNGTELASGESLLVEGPLGAGNYTLTVESCPALDTSFVVTAVADYAFTKTPLAAPTEQEEEEG